MKMTMAAAILSQMGFPNNLQSESNAALAKNQDIEAYILTLLQDI